MIFMRVHTKQPKVVLRLEALLWIRLGWSKIRPCQNKRGRIIHASDPQGSKKYFVDVHKETILISAVILDSTGKLVMESIIETKAAIIPQFLQASRGSLSVTLEEGTCAAWLNNPLKPHVAKVLVCKRPHAWNLL